MFVRRLSHLPDRALIAKSENDTSYYRRKVSANNPLEHKVEQKENVAVSDGPRGTLLSRSDLHSKYCKRDRYRLNQFSPLAINRFASNV